MTMPLVEPMQPADLDHIMALERRCFAAPWTRRMYLLDLTENDLATYLVVRPGDAFSAPPILAWGGFWLLVDEAHIATLASHPAWRGCGLAQWLMLALLDTAQVRGASSSTLEVRAGNLPAQRLYEKLGYRIVGTRRHYYRDGEDGLIMSTPALALPGLRAQLAAVRAETRLRLQRCFADRPPAVNAVAGQYPSSDPGGEDA